MSRVLVIDDSEHLRTVLKITLEFKGHVVDEAGDGAAALALADERDYDLIFCDIEMPTMNGIEFVARFRDRHGATTPVIMLTAESDELTRKALAAGATAAIHKPFEPIRMLQDIEKCLGSPIPNSPA
jgi:CheY-like chemotaxis protein